MFRLKPLALCSLLALLSACSAPQSYQPQIPAGQHAIQKNDVADLKVFPQDLMFFANQAGADTALLTPQQSAEQFQRFRTLFFSAWNAEKPDKNNRKFCWSELDRQGSARGYAENLQPWEDARWEEMQVNAARQNFPSLRQAALTVRPTNLRVVPTNRPRYSDPSKPGQSFPFDEFQLSSVPVGFPIMVFHKSRDGQWLYVESSLISGWVPAKDVAFVDERVQNLWRSSPLAAILREDIPLGRNGNHFAEANIGTVLPMRSASAGASLTLMVPVRNTQGWIVVQNVTVSRDTAAAMPLTLTPRQMATLGNRMMGQPYGWGGLFGDRDCSGMTRDLFTTFGVWLPRNSSAQSKTGQIVSLENVNSKEAVIRAQGVPFLSLIWLPGHIGLYVGEYRGEPAFFHNIWGLRTEGDGRYVLGRAVVTSTKPGKELDIVPPGMQLIDRIKTINMPGLSR